MKPRARRVVLIVIAAALLGAIIAAAGGFYLFGEERRLGPIVGGILSGRLGVPITVERAATRGTGLRLRGVHVPAGGGSAVEIRVGQLDIDGGVLPLIAPAGRRVTIVAASTSVTVHDSVESKGPTAAMEAVRTLAAALLEWPGALSLRVDGGEVTRAGHTFALELTGEKTANGLTVTLALLDAGARALRLTTKSAGAADGVVTTQVDFAAVPLRLAGLWPASLPAAAALAGSGEVRLARGGNMTTTARFTAGDTTTAPVIELTSRWDPAKVELVVSRYAFDWGRDLHLEGAATLPADGRPLGGSAEGTLDGSAVRGRVAYGTSDRAFNGEVRIEPFSARRLAHRLGTAMSTEIAARTLVSRFTGMAPGGRPVVSFDFTGQAVTTPALTRLPLDVAGTATIELASDRAAALGLDASTLTLSRDGRNVGRVTAASRCGGLWPIEVRGTVDDAAALAPLLPIPTRLTGRATVDGEVGGASPLAFRGTVQAQLSEADITAGGHVTFTGIRATVPVGFGAEAPPGGTVTAERVNAYGFTATGLTNAISDNVVVSPKTADRLVFTTQPAGASRIGSPLVTQPVLKSQDPFGNLSTVGLPANLNVTVSLTSGSGSLLGTTALDIGTAAGNGIVTFSNLQCTDAGTNKQLTASAAGFTNVISSSFNIGGVALATGASALQFRVWILRMFFSENRSPLFRTMR